MPSKLHPRLPARRSPGRRLRHPGRVVSTAFLCTWFASGALADVITLAPVADNTLYQDAAGSLSNGSGPSLFAGKTGLGTIRRAVLDFDVSRALHPGAIVQSATLQLHVSRTISGAEPATLHRALVAWGEGASDASNDPQGGGIGASASTGDATWLHTFYPNSLWITPGGDFSASVSATANPGAIGFVQWGSTAQLVADVQGWVNSPATDHGWVLRVNEAASGTAKRFDSREAADPALRPQLTIVFQRAPTDAAPATSRVRLEAAVPNPFNPTTTLAYVLQDAGPVRLEVLSVRGAVVATLVEREATAGRHVATWDGRDARGQRVSSGMYVVRLAAGGQMESTRVVLLK